jgi:hypothetical protein
LKTGSEGEGTKEEDQRDKGQKEDGKEGKAGKKKRNFNLIYPDLASLRPF